MDPPVVSAPSGHDIHIDQASGLHSKFACREDIILLTQVNLFEPWTAPPKGSTAAWEEITALCARQTGFTLKAKKWNALKSRFNLLVSSFRKDEGASLRKSGAPEEYEEREVLLCDIINRMDDYKESEDASRELRKAKTDGIVNSGLLLRRLAVEEVENEDAGSTETLDLSDSSKRSRLALDGQAKRKKRSLRQRKERVWRHLRL
ncbi:hypothetical protein Ae201684P_018646 [Aphanomyces euteiches]|nr:hypothetical protein Ae201684P_018646 [Aphanomyces euteiches]KAH9156260.1 hypothetical protein AeRB84_001843 [Aphanomyces euteiches]